MLTFVTHHIIHTQNDSSGCFILPRKNIAEQALLKDDEKSTMESDGSDGIKKLPTP